MSRRTDRDPELDALALEVEAALRETLDAGPVDVSALLSRTRGAVQARRRRRSWWRVGLGVVAVPVAVGVGLTGPLGAGPGGQTPAPTVLVEPSPSVPAPTVTAGPVAEPDTGPDADRFRVVPWRVAAASRDRNQVAYRIPGSVALTAEDVRGPGEPPQDGPNYGGGSVVPGQTCSTDDVLPRPVAGRLFTRIAEEFQVDVQVSGWAPGTAARRFAEVVANTGRCRFVDAVPEPRGAEGPDRVDESYAATLGSDGTSGAAFAVGRVGELTVGVTVRSFVPVDDPAGQVGSAAALARDYLGTVADRVRASGLVATAARGG